LPTEGVTCDFVLPSADREKSEGHQFGLPVELVGHSLQ
jgi:hypothetical protein